MSNGQQPEPGGTDRRRTSPVVKLLGLAVLGAGLVQWYGAQNTSAPVPAIPTPVAAMPDMRPAPSASAWPATPSATTAAAAVVIELVDVVTVPRGRSRAVLRINGGLPQTFAWGDVVSVGVRLSRILPTGVELQRGTTVELLPLSASANTQSIPAQLQPAESPGGADTSSIIARSADQAAPSSTAIERAIQRSTAQ